MKLPSYILALLSAGALCATETEDKTPVQTLDSITVQSTRTNTELKKTGRSITIIDRQTIENQQVNNLTDVLRQVPGITLKEDGAHSTSTGVFIRGLDKGHTKVLINGIPVQDPSGTQVFPILNSINLSDVERIEVIRGAASTLYGSNAMGGVINIITKNGGEKAIGGQVETEIGSEGFQRYGLTLNGSAGNWDYLINGQWQQEDGITAQSAYPDKDTFRELYLSGQLTYNLGDQWRFGLFGRYIDSNQEYDKGFGSQLGDFDIQTYQLGSFLEGNGLADGLFDTKLTLSTGESRKADIDNTVFGSPQSQPADYIGQTDEIDWQNIVHLNDTTRVLFGATYTEESMDKDAYGSQAKEAYRTQAYFTQFEFEPIENLNLSYGLRYNDHSEFGHKTTYTADASYLIEATGTRLKASWGTGYRAPSLYELHDAYSGNPNLEPEESETWDIGFEQAITETIEMGLTYFESRVTNYIGYASGSYQQIDGIKTYGLESYVTYRPETDWSFTATHTYMHSNDMEKEQSPLLNRPRHQFSLDTNWQATDKLNLNLNGTYTGSRPDVNGSILPSYTLVNLAGTYQMTEALQIFGRVHNLFNEDYESVGGYETYDLSLYGGIKYSF